MADQQLRVRLRVAIKGMLGIAGLAFIYVFGAAFFTPEKRESSPDVMSVGVSQMRPGETIKVNWEGRPILIHRRTDAEIRWLEQPQGGLTDAVSSRSTQPGWAQTPFRSKTPEWFVALAVREEKACTIEVDTNSKHGGFVSPCDGVRFDPAGRLYAGQPETTGVNNMRVPAYDLDDQLVVLGGRVR